MCFDCFLLALNGEVDFDVTRCADRWRGWLDAENDKGLRGGVPEDICQNYGIVVGLPRGGGSVRGEFSISPGP